MSSTLLVGCVKRSSGSSNGELQLEALRKEDADAGWSIDSTKISVSSGTVKPLVVAYSAPQTPPHNTIASIGYGHFVKLTLRGMLKGGNPPPPLPEGRKVVIHVRAYLDPIVVSTNEN